MVVQHKKATNGVNGRRRHETDNDSENEKENASRDRQAELEEDELDYNDGVAELDLEGGGVDDEEVEMNGVVHADNETETTTTTKTKTKGDSTEQRRAQERELRADYRSLGQSVQEFRDNINDTTVDDLGRQVAKANELFRNVTAPSEAVLDSRVLMAASDAGALKARQLKLDADAFDTDQFLVKLAHFMGGNVKGKGRSQNQDGDATQRIVETSKTLRWGRVGRVLASESRRPVVMDLMLGPLALEIKEKKQRQRVARQKIDESQRVRPEELRAEDVEKDKQATDRMISEIARILEAYEDEGLPYMAFVVNPHSFAQTVENIFYFSFLVRDGRACIEEEISEESKHFGEIICYSADPPDGSNDSETSKSQFVFELTQEVWLDAIKAFGLTESAIPHRAKWQEQTNAKWR